MDNKKQFKPFIPAGKVLPEFTITSVIIGIILAGFSTAHINNAGSVKIAPAAKDSPADPIFVSGN